MRRQPRRSRNLWTLGTIIVVAVGIGAFSVHRTGHGTPVNEQGIGIVKRQNLVQDVSVAGTIVPFKRTIFTPPYDAYIKKIYVTVGEKVKAGDAVVSLEQSLKERHEEDFPLRAPFPGTVVQVLHSEGEYVQTSTDPNSVNAMVRIDDLSRLFVTAEVPESDVDKIRVGQSVIVKATPVLDKSYRGVIREIALAAIEKQQQYQHSGDRVEFQVKLEILDADKRLKPGMSTLIDIITDQREQVLVLPHEYIEKRKDQYYVTLESGEHRKIKVGLANDEMFEIQQGLSEGDRVRVVDFASLPQEG